MTTPRVASVFACVVAVILATGCSWLTSSSDDAVDAPTDVSFGDPYRILTEWPAPTDDGPDDVTPRLVAADTVASGIVLEVAVQYTGGCRPHTFALRTDVSGGAARLWLEHDAHDDRCEARPSERLRRALPKAVTRASTIQVLAPERDAPFVLRDA